MKLFKKVLSGITLLAVVSTLLAVTPVSVNAMTEGDIDNAQLITIGQKLKGSIADDSGAWFKFTTSSTKEPWYRIGCIYKDESNYGPHMYLYNEEGEELFEKGIEDGVDNFKHIKLDPDTTYYVNIKFADNTDYTVYVDEIKDDISDNEEKAVSLYSGIKASGKFECVNDSDTYAFTAGSSKTTISASLKYKDTRASIKVFDEDGQSLLNELVYDATPKTYTIDTVKGQKYSVIYSAVEPSFEIVKYAGTYTLTVKSGSSDVKYLTMDSVLNKATQDVYLFNGKVRLTKGIDYTVSVGRVSAGKTTVTVKGKGTYTGSITKTCYVAGN